MALLGTSKSPPSSSSKLILSNTFRSKVILVGKQEVKATFFKGIKSSTASPAGSVEGKTPPSFSTMDKYSLYRRTLVNGDAVIIEFWDTAVSEDIRSATGTYYYQAAAALFMYDATRMDSLHHLHHCHDKLNTFSMGNVVKVLIGINCGEEDVEVSEIEAEAFKDMFEMSLAIRMCRISEEEIKTLIDGVTKALSENSLLRMTDYPPPTDDDDERTTKLCHCCKTS